MNERNTERTMADDHERGEVIGKLKEGDRVRVARLNPDEVARRCQEVLHVFAFGCYGRTWRGRDDFTTGIVVEESLPGCGDRFVVCRPDGGFANIVFLPDELEKQS